MSNSIYILRDKQIDKKIEKIKEEYILVECYSDQNSEIYRNADMLISLKKKYALLRLFPNGNTALLSEIKKVLYS